jgi:hypothetical protein
MFGNTLTINLGTIADPEEVVLKLVREGDFQAEYRLTEADKLHKVIIRHTTEKTKVKGSLMDRHNMTYSQEIFPTEIKPEGEVIEVYTVLRVPQNSLPTRPVPLVNGVCLFTIDKAEELAGWES